MPGLCNDITEADDGAHCDIHALRSSTPTEGHAANIVGSDSHNAPRKGWEEFILQKCQAFILKDGPAAENDNG
jgi:hypothetical protein